MIALRKSRSPRSGSDGGQLGFRDRLRRFSTVPILLFVVAMSGCRPRDIQPPALPPLQPSATLMPAPPASPTQEPAFTLSPGYAPLATNAPTPTLPPFIPVPGQIVFTSELDGRSDLYIINSDGSGFQRLTDNGNSNRDPVWSPDGAPLAFTSLTLGDEGTAQASEIYAMTGDGSGQTSV